MALTQNILIVLAIAVILFLVINHFFLRTNIIWDDLVQGKTSGQSAPIVLSSSLLSATSNDLTGCANTGLIVPNSAFPPLMTSNIMFSIWFFIDDYTQNLDKNKYICSLIGTDSDGFSPTLIMYLTPYNNNLSIAISTRNSSDGNLQLNIYQIDNIPLQKWNCVTLSIIDRTLDVYLEGKLVNSYILEGFYATKPHTSLYVGNNTDSFLTGYITRARYDNGGVNPQQAYSIYKEGINSSFAGDFFNKYRLKVGLYEYNNQLGGFTI